MWLHGWPVRQHVHFWIEASYDLHYVLTSTVCIIILYKDHIYSHLRRKFQSMQIITCQSSHVARSRRFCISLAQLQSVNLITILTLGGVLWGVHLSEDLEEAVFQFADSANSLNYSVICQVIPQCVTSLERCTMLKGRHQQKVTSSAVSQL